MSKAKKIVVAVLSVLILAGVAGFAVFSLSMESIYENISKADPPELIADFDKKENDVIRVMSFNVRCANLGSVPAYARYSVVAETITNSESDSFGVQEATPAWMKYLSSELAGKYEYVGGGRNDGKNSGEYSAIFYLKDKYTKIDSGTFWLSETPDTPSKGWDASFKRICTWIVLENKETGERYVHLNSHFDHKGEEARLNSVDLILDKISEYADLPVVFTADLNIKEGTAAYTRFVDSGIMADTKYEAEDTMNYLTFHDLAPSQHDNHIIDYVMINENFDAQVYKVVTAGIDGKYVSDHFPVYADLKLK